MLSNDPGQTIFVIYNMVKTPHMYNYVPVHSHHKFYFIRVVKKIVIWYIITYVCRKPTPLYFILQLHDLWLVINKPYAHKKILYKTHLLLVSRAKTRLMLNYFLFLSCFFYQSFINQVQNSKSTELELLFFQCKGDMVWQSKAVEKIAENYTHFNNFIVP